MLEVLILAFALSMDAFAVSVGLGAKYRHKTIKTALLSGSYFGVFQGVMPILGLFVGYKLLIWAKEYTYWIAFIILAILGVKMIMEAFSSDSNEMKIKLTHRALIMLAIATSLDAMFAGFGIALIPLSPIIICIIIALVTFFFSFVGAVVGAKGVTFIGKKAELLGGVILIIIGFKLLMF